MEIVFKSIELFLLIAGFICGLAFLGCLITLMVVSLKGRKERDKREDLRFLMKTTKEREEYLSRPTGIFRF